MKRIAVDIGGTFSDCFVTWDDRHIQSKALTTHQNLALGFNEALDYACQELALDRRTVLSSVDSVRYSTTLGTNALIERKGPKLGLLCTAGFDSVVPFSRGRGYGEGLDSGAKMDIPRARRPDPLVEPRMIRPMRERIDYKGEVLLGLDEDDVREQIHELVKRGAEAIVVSLTGSVINPVHELRVQDIFHEEYPGHLLGAIPMVLSHKVAGRKGEYARSMSAIMDAFLHAVMYHGLNNLELNLRESGYSRPMLVVHNSGGMAQMNSTDALQTVHSGPVSGVAASEHLAENSKLGNVVATDMGGTSFDIGMVVEGGIKFYDFNPTIERWLVTTPMVHLVTLGAGGGSIAKYDRMHDTIQVGPQSAGSDPGPACYDRGGQEPTVTDADAVLGYFDADNYANGHIKLNLRRAERAIQRTLCEQVGYNLIGTAKLLKQTVDADMANGIATELRLRGFEPRDFTMLAYGGNGPLHGCGIANALGVKKILASPFASVFSAVGAGNINQMHIHEKSTFTVLFDANRGQLFTGYNAFNGIVEELEDRGREDLLRQGMDGGAIRHRLELDMRYGNQRVETAVVIDEINRMSGARDVLHIIERFHKIYGERFGQGSQAAETGVRINTVRVCSFVEVESIDFGSLHFKASGAQVPAPAVTRDCHFVGFDAPQQTRVYDESAISPGLEIDGPAIVTTSATTYLIEPGWKLQTSNFGAAWFVRD